MSNSNSKWYGHMQHAAHMQRTSSAHMHMHMHMQVSMCLCIVHVRGACAMCMCIVHVHCACACACASAMCMCLFFIDARTERQLVGFYPLAFYPWLLRWFFLPWYQ